MLGTHRTCVVVSCGNALRPVRMPQSIISLHGGNLVKITAMDREPLRLQPTLPQRKTIAPVFLTSRGCPHESIQPIEN